MIILKRLIDKDLTNFITLSIGMGLFILFLNSPVVGPMIQADEGSHLANAAAIAGFHNDFASSYHAGYSLLISPAFYFADSPEQAWLYVKIINSVLYSMGVFFLLLLAKSVYTGSSKILIIGAVIVTSLYPMWVIMAGYAFSQIAFFSFFVLLSYLMQRALVGNHIFWILSALTAGFLYWIHPIGLAVAIALVIAVLFESLSRKHLFFVFYVVFITGVMILSYKLVFVPWLHDRMTISGMSPATHYPSIFKIFGPLFTMDGLKEIISRSSGIIFYLTIGTVGLIWGYFINPLIGYRNSDVSVHKGLLIFLVFSFLGVVALTVLLFTFSSQANRLDHWMYGRYVEGVIAPLILLGVLTFNSRAQLVSLIICFITAILLSFGLQDYTHIARMNVGAFWQDFYLREYGLSVWALSGAGLILLSSALMRFHRFGVLLFFGIVFSFMSFLQVDWHVRAASNAFSRSANSLLVRNNYSPGTCVAFDHAGIDSYNKHVYWFDYAFWLYDYNLQRYAASDWHTDCDGPLFTYDGNLNGKYDVYSVSAGPAGGPFLWSKEKLPFEGRYPFSISDRSEGLNSILHSGWHHLEGHHVWSSENAVINLPVPDECISMSCSSTISFSVFGASPSRPVEIFIEILDNEFDYTKSIIITDSKQQELKIPLSSDKDFQLVSIKIPDAVSPEDLGVSNDLRVLGIALKSIKLIRGAP